jgi:hypothetical protein
LVWKKNGNSEVFSLANHWFPWGSWMKDIKEKMFSQWNNDLEGSWWGPGIKPGGQTIN